MYKILGLGHINVVVDDLSEGINYYQELFSGIPLQLFPHFKNRGFSLSAGFLENPDEVDVSICFIQIPNTHVTLELMEYHNPAGDHDSVIKRTNNIGKVGHICLKVQNIVSAFEHISSIRETKLINMSEDYKPFYISEISPSDFRFFEKSLESNKEEKEAVCNTIKNIRYFYFIDKYNIQWEFEEGHKGIGV